MQMAPTSRPTSSAAHLEQRGVVGCTLPREGGDHVREGHHQEKTPPGTIGGQTIAAPGAMSSVGERDRCSRRAWNQRRPRVRARSRPAPIPKLGTTLTRGTLPEMGERSRSPGGTTPSDPPVRAGQTRAEDRRAPGSNVVRLGASSRPPTSKSPTGLSLKPNPALWTPAARTSGSGCLGNDRELSCEDERRLGGRYDRRADRRPRLPPTTCYAAGWSPSHTLHELPSTEDGNVFGT